MLAGAPLYPLVGHPFQVLRRTAHGPRLMFLSVPQANDRQLSSRGQDIATTARFRDDHPGEPNQFSAALPRPLPRTI